MGLLEAATHAPDWSDESQIEKSLVVQAERTLRHTTASLREEPAEPHEIGAPIEVEGRPTRHLVVGSQLSGRGFDEHDRKALEALTAVGVSAFNRRRLSDEMVYLARHDALTGLHNRGVFTDRLVQALHERGSHGMVAVLYCDLDGFKEVNDLLGHDAGDRLLVLVAERVMTCLREGDTAARLGGDEFGVLLDDITDERQAEAVAQRLLEALEEPFVTADQQVRVRVSIGIAFSGTEPTTAELLINCADTAMYAAKARGKGCVERFHPTCVPPSSTGSSSRRRCATPCARTGSACTTSRSSTSARVGSTASRRSRAGTTRLWAACGRTCSSPPPSASV